MEIQRIQNTPVSFGRYGSDLIGLKMLYTQRRLYDLGRKCDIFVKQEEVPFYLKWLKGETIFHVFVGKNRGFCDALPYKKHSLYASITEKQLAHDSSQITKTAVKLAKRLHYI